MTYTSWGLSECVSKPTADRNLKNRNRLGWGRSYSAARALFWRRRSLLRTNSPASTVERRFPPETPNHGGLSAAKDQGAGRVVPGCLPLVNPAIRGAYPSSCSCGGGEQRLSSKGFRAEARAGQQGIPISSCSGRGAERDRSMEHNALREHGRAAMLHWFSSVGTVAPHVSRGTAVGVAPAICDCEATLRDLLFLSEQALVAWPSI